MKDILNNDKQDDDKLPQNKTIYVMFILFLALYMYMGLFGNQQIADQMAKNPNNIIKDCMYYVRDVKRRHSYVTEVKIDGRVYETYLIYASQSDFFLSSKYSEFKQYMRENQELCHPIGYVELINLGFYKKIYVYYYYGDFKLN
ncbi:MAG: hypothetical protein Q3971_05550 [Moraxella sp.]|nr:hypothetical protein [Moraxella sp.]